MEPDTSSDQRPVIPASEILGKIERAEDVEYDSVIIEGDLDISELDLPTEHLERTEKETMLGLITERRVIRSKITITDSEVQGNVNFDNAHFGESINFTVAKFSRNAEFMRAEFDGDANFGGAEFDGDANFEGAEFTGGLADFAGAKFAGGIANFGEAKFTGGDANFGRAEFTGGSAYFWGAEFTGGFADFGGAKFTSGEANFGRAEFTGGCAYFWGAEFTGWSAIFRGAKFSGGKAFFRGTEFGGYADFGGAEFAGQNADFGEAKFSGGKAFFRGIEFGGYADFGGAEFSCGNADFGEAKFTGGYADFGGAKFSSYDVSFEDTKFTTPASQEVACRIAKRKMEEKGVKQKADYYFFREMEAIRIQDGIRGVERKMYPPPANIRERSYQFRDRMIRIPPKIKRFLIHDVLEYIFIQRIFGYGVRPFNVAKAWLSVVFFLGVVYWAGAGVVRGDEPLEWYEYFYFSIVTAATPGYAGYTPATGFYTLIAGAQAIFGTFMWAAFIATFARKWQR